MQPHLNKSQGFTLIEVTLVIIVMGLLMAGLAPLLLRQHSGTMEARDNTALEDAKTAIINYAISFGGIPDPLTMALDGNSANPFIVISPSASVSGSNLGAMTPSASAEAALASFIVPALGVNNWGAMGSATKNVLLLDVNNALKSSSIQAIAGATASDKRVVFCQAGNAQSAPGIASTALPRICQDTAADHPATAACNTSTTSSPAAFVLIGTGADRKPNQENDEGATGFENNRVYENDRRGTNSAPGETRHYDDQVKSYPLSGFARDCREKMGVSAEVMSCAPGQKWVGSLTNNSAAAVTYTLSGTAPSVTGTTPGNSFTNYINTCVARTESMDAGNTIVLNAGDTNSDGRIDFVINVAGTLTSQ
jgi:prepilin-type N-terminal cleavage/methylation domain-containing protein